MTESELDSYDRLVLKIKQLTFQVEGYKQESGRWESLAYAASNSCKLLESKLDFEAKTHAKTLALLDASEKKEMYLQEHINFLTEELSEYYAREYSEANH
jgi:homoserine trans-succinylase